MNEFQFMISYRILHIIFNNSLNFIVIMSNLNSVLKQLKLLSNKSDREGMNRFGINVSSALGIRMPVLRKISKSYKNDHDLAIGLWNSGYHEARILASLVDDHKLLTSNQIDDWVKDFQSWDLCDQVCGNLFCKSPLIVDKILEYSDNEEEFIKRTAFSLMAAYAVKGKKINDQVFIDFLPIIEKQAYDNRNFVKKAVN